MEATIQQNNISTNVSINIASFVASVQNALQAIKQHLWLRVHGAWLRVMGPMSLPRLYRKGLRAARWMDCVASEHPTIFNIVLGLLGICMAYLVVNYNFTTNV